MTPRGKPKNAEKEKMGRKKEEKSAQILATADGKKRSAHPCDLLILGRAMNSPTSCFSSRAIPWLLQPKRPWHPILDVPRWAGRVLQIWAGRTIIRRDDMLIYFFHNKKHPWILIYTEHRNAKHKEWRLWNAHVFWWIRQRLDFNLHGVGSDGGFGRHTLDHGNHAGKLGVLRLQHCHRVGRFVLVHVGLGVF